MLILPEPMALLDDRGRVNAANPPLHRLLGADSQTLTGRRLRELAADAAVFDNRLALWGRSSSARPAALQLIAGDGAAIHLRCEGARVGRGAILLRFRSVTETGRIGMLRRDVDTASLDQLKARLRAALTDLHHKNAALSRRNDELSAYAAAVAHDLRNPLFVIAGYADLLRDTQGSVLDEDGIQLLDELVGATERMAEVIDALLSLARSEVTPPDHPTDPGPVLSEVIAEFGAELHSTDGQMIVGDLPPAWIEPVHLRQVLTNLLSNSIKFHHPDRALIVHVSGVDLGDATEFRVDDNGRGVPPVDRQRIFDAFARGLASEQAPGLGIGLATTRKLVESLGGTIRCEPLDDDGARFVFNIPRPSVPRPSATATPAADPDRDPEVAS